MQDHADYTTNKKNQHILPLTACIALDCNFNL